MDLAKKARYIRNASLVALFGNASLAVAKIVLAYFSGSLAVLGDGIDSSTDVLIAVVALIVSRVTAEPGDKEHPWGHSRAETTASLVLSCLIFFAGAQVVMQSASSIFLILRGEKSLAQESLLAVFASGVSILGKSLLAAAQFHYARVSDSEIIKANAQNMKSDIVLSAGVLLGVGAANLFGQPLLDPAIAILVGLWVVKNAVGIFCEINLELMDGNTDNSLYKKLFDAASSVSGVANPHRARIRKIGPHFDVDLDIEVDPAMSVFCAHELSEQVEENVRLAIPEVYDIVIHIEPSGSDLHQREEKFGLRREFLDTDTHG